MRRILRRGSELFEIFRWPDDLIDLGRAVPFVVEEEASEDGSAAFAAEPEPSMQVLIYYETAAPPAIEFDLVVDDAPTSPDVGLEAAAPASLELETAIAELPDIGCEFSAEEPD